MALWAWIADFATETSVWFVDLLNGKHVGELDFVSTMIAFNIAIEKWRPLKDWLEKTIQAPAIRAQEASTTLAINLAEDMNGKRISASFTAKTKLLADTSLVLSKTLWFVVRWLAFVFGITGFFVLYVGYSGPRNGVFFFPILLYIVSFILLNFGIRLILFLLKTWTAHKAGTSLFAPKERTSGNDVNEIVSQANRDLSEHEKNIEGANPD